MKNWDLKTKEFERIFMKNPVEDAMIMWKI